MNTDQSSLSGIKVFPQDLEAFRNQKTLRDEFAMAALTGLLARDSITRTSLEANPDAPEQFVAECAYDLADAMLEQRSK